MVIVAQSGTPKWFALKNPLAGFDWSPPILLLTLLLVAAITVLLLWLLPRVQVRRSEGLTYQNRFDRENEARKTLAQILGGMFLLAGLYSSVQTFDLSREGQITDRFTKAIEQLGAVNASSGARMEVRLGGIYALERIARDSERDHWVIMETLTAYVRMRMPWGLVDTNAKRAKSDKQAFLTDLARRQQPEADIQAIVTVLGRRERRYDKGLLDLRNTDLRGVSFVGGNFARANFYHSNLSNSQLGGAILDGAGFEDAVLTDARSNEAYLRQAFFRKAHLVGAALVGAHLAGADLSGADLQAADLTRADLSGADLNDVRLIFTDLSGAELTGVRNLTQAQLDYVMVDTKTKLPPGLRVGH